MKTWMKLVVAVQVVSVLIWIAQAVSLWPGGWWAAGWLLGLPGSALGPWAADQLLWMRASRLVIGIAGLVLATLVNLVIAYALGLVGRLTYKGLKG